MRFEEQREALLYVPAVDSFPSHERALICSVALNIMSRVFFLNTN